MSQTKLEERRQCYFQLNTHLAQLDNEQLTQLFDKNDPTQGWGINHIIKLSGTQIFVKKIPLTSVEYQNLFSTKNLYDLPTFYNYGVGSAGFGAFRELVSHIKTTNWVLAGEIAYFPIMYHYRIVPSQEKQPPLDMERYQKYVQYWNSDPNIKRYGIARRNAEYELIIFLEYFPHNVWKWFGGHLDKTDQLLDEMHKAINFLQNYQIIHFDVHFGNIVTDGAHFYLTDFGLALDKSFDLSFEERSFFEKNRLYDYGELLYSFVYQLGIMFDDLAEDKKEKIATQIGLTKEMTQQNRLSYLLDHIDLLAKDEMMALDKRYVDTLIKYEEINRLMDAFFEDMGKNNSKDTKFKNEKLKILLDEVGFLD